MKWGTSTSRGQKCVWRHLPSSKCSSASQEMCTSADTTAFCPCSLIAVKYFGSPTSR